MGCLDLSDRWASLDAKRDPPVEIDATMPWGEFRPVLERVWRKPEAKNKSRPLRKPMDAVVMFKTLVLGALHNLSDDRIECQIRNHLSFSDFLALGWRTGCPTQRPSGSIASDWRRRGRSRRVSTRSTAIWHGRATSRAAGRPSTPPSCRSRRTATRTRQTRMERYRRAALTRPPSDCNKQSQREYRRPLDEETWQEPIRLQEPRERRPPAQAGPPLPCQPCGAAWRLYCTNRVTNRVPLAPDGLTPRRPLRGCRGR